VKPSEDGGENETLPGFEADELAGEFALDVRAEFDEFADALGRGEIEAVREGRITGLRIRAFAASKIIELALASKANPFAGRDLGAEDLANVFMSESDVGRMVGEI
jgi:hypothetical protein